MVVGANHIYKIKLLALQQPLANLSLEYHKCASAECNTMQQKNQSKHFDPSDHSLSLSLTRAGQPRAAGCKRTQASASDNLCSARSG
jgi:hypothetical protein